MLMVMQKIGFFNYRISAIVVLLLAMQSMLLAYSATLHSPTYLEPAFLASGIAHWEFGRFEPYRVNPPLVRMVAAIPVFAAGYQADWGHFYEVPGARSEFPLGDAFLRANGKRIVPLIIYARWACIPFSLLGAFFAYRWARELYGATAGLLALILFVFEPNLLAHGELITPDAACTGCGILAGYTFWRWLKCPTWIRACVAGGSMGLAELSKTSWLILFGVWWVLWFVWRCLDSKKLARIGPIDDRAADRQADRVKEQCLEHHGELENLRPPALQLIAIQFLALYVVNLGYGFDGTGTLLRDFSFVSRTLTGLDKSGQPGNRFRDSVLGRIPLPVPKQYVLGIDSQKKDFEGFSHRSYLRGEWSEHGWWYYYIYGLLVKVPCGIWGLFAITIGCRVLQKNRPAPLRDELVLLVPAIALLALVSSQSEFSIHL